MKKTFAFIAALATIAFAGAVSAAPLFNYVQGNLGGNYGDDFGRNAGGAAWSVAAGRDTGTFRTEIEYQGADVGHFGKLQAGNVNAYYQPTVKFLGLSPYVGAGLGYGQVVDRDSVLFNVQAGVTYPVTDKLKAVIGYRFTDAAQNGGHVNSVTTGLRYTF